MNKNYKYTNLLMLLVPFTFIFHYFIVFFGSIFIKNFAVLAYLKNAFREFSFQATGGVESFTL